MAVGNIATIWPRKGTRWYIGEFVVAAGAITAGTVKYKGEVAVTWISTGIINFQCLNNGVASKPSSICRLAAVIPGPLLPGATVGGWSSFLNVDSMNTNGSFRWQFNQQSFAVADTVGICKLAFCVEMEAA